jgi:hypothetical protein
MLIRSSIASSSCSKRPHWRHTVNRYSRSPNVCCLLFCVYHQCHGIPIPPGYNIRDRLTARLSRPVAMFLETWREVWPRLPIDRTKRWRELVVHATKRQSSRLPPLLDFTYIYLFYFARMTTKRVYLLRHGQAEHKSVCLTPLWQEYDCLIWARLTFPASQMITRVRAYYSLDDLALNPFIE